MIPLSLVGHFREASRDDLMAARQFIDGLLLSRATSLTCAEQTKDIIAEVALPYGLTVEDMKANRGSDAATLIRQKAYYEVKAQRPHLSFPMIGKVFGGRDHTTIIHGKRRHEARMAWVAFLKWAATPVEVEAMKVAA